jgi:hypothetical protein
MDRISNRALNRTTLLRQSLLDRSNLDPKSMIEHLVGMQAQNPQDPYFALWSRLTRFDPTQLSGMVERAEAVRGALLRATIHLATTSDFLRLRPQLQVVCTRTLGSTAFAKDTRDVDRDELIAIGRTLVEERPMTRAQLSTKLGERWPDVPAASLAQVATYLLPVIQVPPRGLWGRSGSASWTTIERWTGSELATETSVEETYRRYLAAFGPASVADARNWSGLPGLRQVSENLRPQLRSFRAETGIELLDLPDHPIVDEDTPAPPRFLPEYDNVLLGHSDRSRFFVDGPIPLGWEGNLLVDGVFSGGWKLSRDKTSSRLEVEVRRKVTKAELNAVAEEAQILAGFADADIADREAIVRQAW